MPFFSRLTIFSMFATILFSCGNKTMDYCASSPDIDELPAIDIQIERLEKSLFEAESPEEVFNFLKSEPQLTQQFLDSDEYPNLSYLADQMFKLANDPYIDTLYQDVNKVFGDLSELENEFAAAFRHIKYYFPDFKAPRIATMITGLSKDLMVSDSLIVLGLDFFIGPGAKFRPIDVPGYIMKRYQKEYIVPAVILLYSDKYNRTDYADQTLLADMIYYGKSYHFTKTMMPCLPDSLLIGYSGEELIEARENQELIWAHFVQNQLFYETGTLAKTKYTGERPKTFEIGEKAPGRIGVWLGWEIVKHYALRHPDMHIAQFMAKENAQEIFKQSKYKPKN